MVHTSDDLIRTIKMLGAIPDGQDTFSDLDLLSLVDSEILTYVVPKIISVNEEYYVNYTDYQIRPGKTYRIPSRAIGGKLRDVICINNGSFKSVPRVSPENLNKNSLSFYLRSNSLVLVPDSLFDGILRLSYFLRPNKVVKSKDALRIVKVDNNTYTVNREHHKYIVGQRVDIVKGTSGFETCLLDAQIKEIEGHKITLTETSEQLNVDVGDWISLVETTPVPQIPLDYFPFLAERVVYKVLESLGDAKGASQAEKSLSEMENNVVTIITPRIEGELKKIKTSKQFKF